MKWVDPPPLTLISGKQTYLVRREMKRGLAALRDRRLLKVPGDDYGAIHDSITTPSMFDVTDTLLLIEKPEKLPSTDVLVEHVQAGENDIAVIIPLEGDPTAKIFGNLLKVLPDEHHLKFPQPKPWDVEKEAIEFCEQEARSRGMKLDRQGARALVAVVGTDYGVLANEMLKAILYVRGQGRKRIERADLGRVVAHVYKHEAFPVVDALAARNKKRLLRQLGMVEKTSKDDPSMKVCGLLGHSVSQWIRAAHLMEQGYEPKEAAQRMGVHPFPFKKDLVPITKRWKVSELIPLLKGIASVERGVKTGRANPWVQLNALLYQAC
jgi:DNA polymerase-3 subunit delta